MKLCVYKRISTKGVHRTIQVGEKADPESWGLLNPDEFCGFSWILVAPIGSYWLLVDPIGSC
jgi:hypothetical protein